MYTANSTNQDSINRTAERIIDAEIYTEQTDLVNALLANQEFTYFSVDNMENLYPDPKDWSAEQCRNYLQEHNTALNGISEVDALRELVNETSYPVDPSSWWSVSAWLAEKLIEIGEVVLTNTYGNWWGRTEGGQAIILDGVIQKVVEVTRKKAAEILGLEVEVDG